MGTFISTTTYVVVSCYACSALFGMDELLYNRRARDGREFFCPNGHAQVFRDSREKELEKALAQERRLLSAREHELRIERASHQATTRRLSRLEKRIKGGACPCCKRQFTDLQRHMNSKHPDYAK